LIQYLNQNQDHQDLSLRVFVEQRFWNGFFRFVPILMHLVLNYLIYSHYDEFVFDFLAYFLYYFLASLVPFAGPMEVLESFEASMPFSDPFAGPTEVLETFEALLPFSDPFAGPIEASSVPFSDPRRAFVQILVEHTLEDLVRKVAHNLDRIHNLVRNLVQKKVVLVEV
jgi:hypothetical protein